MKKLSTVRESGSKIFREHKLTIGLDLGDRSSYYCVLDEAGQVIQEGNVDTNKKAMARVFGSMAAVESAWKSARILHGSVGCCSHSAMKWWWPIPGR